MTSAHLQFLDVAQNQQQTFGQWLRTKRIDARLTVEALAKKAGISKQYLSVLERAEPHALTGKAVTPKVQLVDKLGKALGTIDDARLAAGYAPKKVVPKPTNLPELIQALEDLGLPVPQLSDGWEGLVKEEDGFEEALDRIRYDLEAVIRRIEKGRKRLRFETSTLPVADVDLDDLVGQQRRKIG